MKQVVNKSLTSSLKHIMVPCTYFVPTAAAMELALVGVGQEFMIRACLGRKSSRSSSMLLRGMMVYKLFV